MIEQTLGNTMFISHSLFFMQDCLYNNIEDLTEIMKRVESF